MRFQSKKLLQKIICGLTATTFSLPAMTYAAEENSIPDVATTPATEVDLGTETSMFDRVPADSWIYTSINKLIATGKVPRYKNKIKQGATFTRFELALITYYGIREMKFMTQEEQAILAPLEEEFRYDL